MFFSGAIPAAIFLILLFFVPETPRYLVMKGQNKNPEGAFNAGKEKLGRLQR
jgi:hypothetical protein